MLEKYCKDCDTTKPIDQFYTNSRTKDGVFYQCKACCYIRQTSKGQGRSQSQSKKTLLKRQIAGCNRMLKASGFSSHLTYEQYNTMLETQHNECDICNQPLIQPHIDHDHTTGKIRSLLCHKCNVLLGMSKEDITVLEKAITYLHKHK